MILSLLLLPLGHHQVCGGDTVSAVEINGNVTFTHISYHITSYHIISYHIISYHIISYHINNNLNIPTTPVVMILPLSLSLPPSLCC